MSQYFIYYSSSNIVALIIFGIMLAHDRFSVDRQEKQLKYDHVLLSFMLYFLSDSIWAGVDSGLFPANKISVPATSFANFVLMTAITYTWLRFVMAVEQLPNRNRLKTKHIIVTPFAFSVIMLIFTYLAAPSFLIRDNLKTTFMFDVFMVVIPCIYIVAVILYSLRKASKENNPIEKKKHLYIGFFPILVVAGGLVQMVVMPTLPIFCFCSTIFMLVFYIQSIESQISTDPLTKLNNRGQLFRYVSQESNLWIEDRETYVVMMDINDFKQINDTFGHAEGDSALVILSSVLMNVVRMSESPTFLGRYGGDEFVMVVHPLSVDEIENMIGDLRSQISEKCESEKKPYIISIGVGYDQLVRETDAFLKCSKRADEKLYADKEIQKSKRH